MSTSAASHLPPAFPGRAAWGTAEKLRAWQAAAVTAYLRADAPDFLAVATPGAGKTTYALRLATELIGRGVVERVTVVAPTEHLKSQWADAAGRVGISLDPRFSNAAGRHSDDYQGMALTYAQVAARPGLHRQLTTARRTLVVLDEIHHGGDAKSWGEAIREAFEPATRRLSLTGTPFRSDTSPIPFVRYEMDHAGILTSAADYNYGLAYPFNRSSAGRRLARVVRPAGAPGSAGSHECSVAPRSPVGAEPCLESTRGPRIVHSGTRANQDSGYSG